MRLYFLRATAWSRRRALACALVGSGLALPGIGHAANIVQDPNFSAPIAANWQLQLSASPDPAGAGVLTHGTPDVGNMVGSGSGEVALLATQPAARAAASVRQCVVLNGGATPVTEANYGGRIRIPTAGNTADGSVNAQVEIRFFSDAACTSFIPGTGGNQGRTLTPGVPDDAYWYRVGDAHFLLPPGSVAASVEIRGTVRRVNAGSAASSAFFDDLYIGLNGTTPVELMHFDVE
ncbi:hypothetical protein [Tahibacter amnicola]|uniref:Uncharacterized protein n=1 Tax=Tahibacter amnicola TaxID=2976241 RepID=A0ABY6BH08_9GAMM|nr:hypothetical protein [Tahibacter amnicola]UXI69304.1 hypothetical protein N4264_06555 [Tahibacter amnicola]